MKKTAKKAAKKKAAKKKPVAKKTAKKVVKKPARKTAAKKVKTDAVQKNTAPIIAADTTPKSEIRTRVFAHKGVVGIQSDLKSLGLINNPAEPGQLGFVLDSSTVEMSVEAIDALQQVKKGNDDLGEVDIFKADDGKTIFGFLGGPLKVFKPSEIEGSKEYDPANLKNIAIIVPNDPPAEFIELVDSMPSSEE